MAREMLNEEMLEDVVGGNITYKWRNGVGSCGLNGNYNYTFSNKSAFVAAVMKYYSQGMNDAQILAALVNDGVIH